MRTDINWIGVFFGALFITIGIFVGLEWTLMSISVAYLMIREGLDEIKGALDDGLPDFNGLSKQIMKRRGDK